MVVVVVVDLPLLEYVAYLDLAAMAVAACLHKVPHTCILEGGGASVVDASSSYADMAMPGWVVTFTVVLQDTGTFESQFARLVMVVMGMAAMGTVMDIICVISVMGISEEDQASILSILLPIHDLDTDQSYGGQLRSRAIMGI